jgi:protein TonB
MFEDFTAPPAADKTRKRRFAASTGLAMAVYAAIGVSVVVLASPQEQAKDEDLLDVTFEHTLKKEAPPPPPPKVEPPKPKPKPKLAMAAPTVIPDQKPAEADPSQPIAAAEVADPSAAIGEQAAAPALEKPVEAPPPPKPKPKKAEPVSLPEDADPPEPCENNAPPQYPEAARTAGIEGKVILKLAISETGQVIDIKVLKGDPMLAEAALAAVKTWCFSPAMLDGKPIAVYKIQPVSFSSSVGG